MKQLIVTYAPGKIVLIGKIEVLILQICISQESGVSYEVCWWDHLERKKAWVLDCEITSKQPDQKTDLTLGFIT